MIHPLCTWMKMSSGSSCNSTKVSRDLLWFLKEFERESYIMAHIISNLYPCDGWWSDQRQCIPPIRTNKLVHLFGAHLIVFNQQINERFFLSTRLGNQRYWEKKQWERKKSLSISVCKCMSKWVPINFYAYILLYELLFSHIEIHWEWFLLCAKMLNDENTCSLFFLSLSLWLEEVMVGNEQGTLPFRW